MKLIKILVIVLSAVMLMNIMGTTVSAASLSKSVIIITEGESTSITLNGSSGKKIWGIGNSDIFDYSKGTVTGKSEGIAYLTCENNGKKYKCKIVVVKDENMISSDKASVNVKSGSETYAVVDVSGMKSVKISMSGSDYITAKKSVSGSKIILTIKGKKAGTAKITIKNKNNSSDKKVITVNVDNAGGSIGVNTGSSKDNNNSADPVQEVLDLVNKARKENGKEPLVLNDELCQNAQLRAEELADRFSHTRPNGKKCFTAITVDYRIAGENIAKGHTSAEMVVEAWLNSSGHRKNILSDKFTQIGIGYDPSTNSWVQLFIG